MQSNCRFLREKAESRTVAGKAAHWFGESSSELTPFQAAANPRWPVLMVTWTRHEQSSSGAEVLQHSCQKAELFTALLTQQSKKTKNTHSCLFISSLFLYPPPPPPLWWMEGMNSPRPPWVSLWGPQQLNKQRALNLKAQSGIYLNHVHFGCICVWFWSAPEGTWKTHFCRVVITQNLLFFLYNCNCKQTSFELLLSTLIYQRFR